MDTGLFILEIKDATKEDEGKYKMVAENEGGELTVSVSVQVLTAPVKELVTEDIADDSETVTEITDVDGEKVTKTTTESKTTSVGDDGEVVTKVTKTQVTKKVTVVEESSSEEESSSAEDVEPPEIVQFPEPAVVSLGETVQLTAKIKGVFGDTT